MENTRDRLHKTKITGTSLLPRRTAIAVFSSCFPPAFLGGGPIRTIDALVRAAPAEYDTRVFTGNVDLGQTEALDVPTDQWSEYETAQVFYCDSRSSRSYLRFLAEVRASRPDVLYFNSFFDPRFSIGPQIARRLGLLRRPAVVIAPRGEFSVDALALKRAKKRCYVWAFKVLGFNKAIWHASSEREKRDIQGVMGRKVRVLVREDDTDLPQQAVEVPERVPGPVRAVNVARLVPIKGMKLLLAALSNVKGDLELDVFGPAEDAVYAQDCFNLAKSLPSNVVVTFRGVLGHDEVQATIADYDLMLMPTQSENFGHVIAESLAAACPVMCGDGTPWTSWLRAGGGVLVEPYEVDAWTEAIEEYAKLNADEIRSRRANAADVYAQWEAKSSSAPHFFTAVAESLRLPR